MKYTALASDYDGTLAREGRVAKSCIETLRNFRGNGLKLVLVTGRQLEDLLEVFPEAGVFDRIVAENGAVLYGPESGSMELLCNPPRPEFIEALRMKQISPSVGRAIVAFTERDREAVCLAINETRTDLRIIENKGSLIALPSGVDKASGLRAALSELGMLPGETAGIGDAENDLDFLKICGISAAVANALPSVKKEAGFVCEGEYCEGVAEFICDVLLQTPGEIPINGIIDLHTFRPGEVKSLLPEYFRACLQRGIFSVRIIHGKGTGTLRRTVQFVLERSPEVVSFHTAPETEGGWGATIAVLRHSNPA